MTPQELYDTILKLDPFKSPTNELWASIYKNRTLTDIYSATWIYREKDKIRSCIDELEALENKYNVHIDGECCAREIYINPHVQVYTYEQVENAEKLLLKNGISL